MRDRRRMQWSASRSIEVFWEEEMHTTCGDPCGSYGAEQMNKADGDVGNGKKEQ